MHPIQPSRERTGPRRSVGGAHSVPERPRRTVATERSAAARPHPRYADRIDALDAAWRGRLGRVRANSALDLLLARLPGTPVITVETAARLVDRSEMRVGEAVNRLLEPGVLRQRNVVRRRYRVFEASEVVDLFIGLERALASPTGDTAASLPIRRVPRRPTV